MSIVDQLEATGEVLSPAVRAAITGLEATITLLQERVRELEAQLGLNSTNSSKPPSSDPPGTVRPAKKPTGKKRGGQKGHRGHHRKRVAAERVTTIPHRPESCGHCGHTLAGAEEAKAAHVHQVVELPPIQAEVTEHRMECLRCPRCRKLTRGKLPAEVGGKHFGPRLVGLGSLLIGRYRLSRRETVDLLGKLLDVPPPSLGSTEAFTQETSSALKPAYEEVRAEVLRSDTAGVDETPWRLGGAKYWLWVAVTRGATVFHLGPSRGSKELKEFLGSTFKGTIISDRWCAYQIYARRQLCWAHLIRNFRKLALRGGKAVEFAELGEAACARVFKLWWSLCEGKLDRAQLAKRIKRIQSRLRSMVWDGMASSDKKVAGFCRNLQRLWPSLWTFVTEAVEVTNNAAERALRPAVLWRKGSFGSQSETGLRYAERILTFAATCKLRQIHPLEYLALAVSAVRSGTDTPQFLPAH